MKWWMWALIGAGVLAAGTGAAVVVPAVLRRRKLTNTKATPDGWVEASPQRLAAEAGLDIEAYTLARFLGSEIASGNNKEKVAVAWTIKNTKNRRGWTFLKLATETTRYGNRGQYGSQEHGRFASTSRDPTAHDAEIAKMVLSGKVADPTAGATKWFDPETQRIMNKKRPCGVPRTGEDKKKACYRAVDTIIREWEADKSERVAVSGTNAKKLMFFRPIV